MSDRIVQALHDLADTARATADSLEADITAAADMIRSTIASGRTLFFCGNGGSAADAQHLATEYVVRYQRARKAVAAIALTTDSSLLTAAANDLGFEQVFARQLEALARPGDLLIIHSTSGESPNVLRAAESARAAGCARARLLGAWRRGAALARRSQHRDPDTAHRPRAGAPSLHRARDLRARRARAMIDLKGRRALVTGGSRGMGAATALLLADCGADVGIGYRSREHEAQDVVRQIADRGVRGFAHAADLSVPGGTDSLFARATRELGGLDIFVGNSGIWPPEDVATGAMDDERWRTDDARERRRDVLRHARGHSRDLAIMGASCSCRAPRGSAARRATRTTRRRRAR